MKTKVLLIAALLAAGLISALAQVYSVNSIGYVNVSIPPNRQALLNNPLNLPDNSVGAVIPMPNNAGYAGSAIFRYGCGNPPGFLDPIEWFDDFGWYSASDPDPVLDPGEGFFFRNTHASQPAVLTFMGDVLQGHQVIDVPGTNRLCLRGSQTARALPIGDTTINAAGTLQFPADNGDAVFFYNYTKTPPGYDDPFEYFDGYGWFAATGDQGPAGPLLNIAVGFAVRKGLSSPNRNWAQDFSVKQ